VKRFGAPGRGSADGKVTGTYHFQDARMRSIEIYDWKATTLYDARTGTGTLALEDFWSSSISQEFCVAASAGVDLARFADWLGAAGFRSTRA
jgi:hypothetical protein